MDRTTLYDFERQRKIAVKAGRFIEEQEILESLVRQTMHVPHLQYRITHAEDYVSRAYISKDIFAATSTLNENDGYQEIAGRVNEFKEFVEQLMEVDLSAVEIVRVAGDFGTVEGRSYACGENEHFVLLPPENGGFVSPDLLIHELGHTAEYSLRRRDPDDECLVSFEILSESIAHFCQFRYLRENGTRKEKLSGIQSILPDYLLLKAYQASVADPHNGPLLIPRKVRRRPEVKDVQDAFGWEKFNSFLEAYRNQNLDFIYHRKAVARLGAILALRYLDNPGIIRRFCTVKAGASLPQTLRTMEIDPEIALNFSDGDELIKQFLK